MGSMALDKNVEGRPPAAPPAGRLAVRGVYLVIWGLCSLALLAEFCFAQGDLRRARARSRGLAAAQHSRARHAPEAAPDAES
ncbi:MAG: hypothetical protein ACRD2T_10810, partial [Thermoanaerobaculia bacterium]